MKSLKKVVLLVLIAVMILSFAACGKKVEEPAVNSVEFKFKVVDLEGNEKVYDLKTEREFLGDALLDEKLIEGEIGSYGLYVTSVDGMALDYNKDQAYWALYIGDEYAMTGVDSTPVEAGKLYTFKAEKAA
ncbi:MAG: DUF4430 domain-containing protein [Clostridia bacterium]|nr:DUF4430 domain-containing protein [Clostridia bacterium]